MANLPTDAAPEILDALTKEANNLLSSVIKGTLVPFNVGSQGNFPYYYQMPSTLQFNGLTYNWISKRLASGAVPAMLENEPFINNWIKAISSVSFQYSTQDQATLNKALQNAQQQQTALLGAWKSAFGELPQPIAPQLTVTDQILFIITSTWAVPQTNLLALQQAPDIRQLLNNAPASGLVILPALSSFLQALSTSVTLQNAGTSNNGYLSFARANAQTPSSTNGGIVVSGSPATVPAYTVNTPLADIVNGLASRSNAISLQMSVLKASQSEFSVSVNGGTSFKIPFGWFFSLGVDAQANYFQDQIVASSNRVEITQTYPGVTLVNFGPSPINLSTKLNWFWPSAVVSAIKNGKADVTDFKFAPDPRIDFSSGGDFGFLNALAISEYPTIVIKVSSANYEAIYKTLQTSTKVRASFLGIPLFSGGASTYSHSQQIDAASKTVTITMSPPPQGMGQTVDQNVAWVLGAQLDYPGAIAHDDAHRFQTFLAHMSKRHVSAQ